VTIPLTFFIAPHHGLKERKLSKARNQLSQYKKMGVTEEGTLIIDENKNKAGLPD